MGVECGTHAGTVRHRKNKEKLCLECFTFQRQYLKQWRQNNKDKAQAYSKTRPKKKMSKSDKLKYRYGITLEQYIERFEAQGRKCACCGVFETEARKVRWHVEHCHSTKKIRGICCERCNRVIGQLGDNALAVATSVTVILKYLANADDKLTEADLEYVLDAIRNNTGYTPAHAEPRISANAFSRPRHSPGPYQGTGQLGRNGSGYYPEARDYIQAALEQTEIEINEQD